MAGKADGTGPPDVEVTMKDLLSQPGVKAYMVFNDMGIPVKWSSSGFSVPSATPGVAGGATQMPIPPEITHYAALISDLTVKSKATCRRVFFDDDLESSELVYFRMRTKNHEVIVAPGDGCTLVVLQGEKETAVAKTEEEGKEGEAKK